jgi:hypothetical protein
MDRLSTFGRALTLIGGLWLMGHASIAAAQEQIIHVATVDQLILAVNTANQTQQTTHITVAPGHYQFAQSFASNYGPSVLPTIRSAILIVGEDAATTIFDAGNVAARIFTVLQTGNLFVRNITLTNGQACLVEDCDFAGGGGALNFRGVLTFAECIISSNATLPADIDPSTTAARGGGLMNVGGILTLEQSTVTGNEVFGYGGGLALIGGSTSIYQSIISNNAAALTPGPSSFTSFGGGIYVASGELLIDSSTISGNSAGPPPNFSMFDIGIGGGIYNAGGTVTITNSAVTANSATNLGSGGGIYNSAAMTIEDSTVAGNTAATSGGGLYNASLLQMQGVTVAGNQALGNTLSFEPLERGSFPAGCNQFEPQTCVTGGNGVWTDPGASTQVANSVLANNAGSDCVGVLTSNGHNALSSSAGCTLKPSPALQGHTVADQINVDPRLGAPQDNGAAGNAHYPLLPGSPLIDAGGAVGRYCSALDQLGQKRVEGDGKSTDGTSICDIGAIEFTPQ